MNRQHFLLVASLSAAFVGCADGVEEEAVHAVYSPSTGNIPVPNDLLYSGSQDATLNIPVADPSDLSDPQVAINTLEGWSTVAPFNLGFSDEVEASSAIPGETLRIFEVTVDTTAAPVGGPVTGIVGEVTAFEVGYAPGDSSESTLQIRPTQPLKPNTVYMVVATTGIRDDDGRRIVRDLEYNIFAADGIFYDPTSPDFDPADASAAQLEFLIESMLFAATGAGIDRSEVVVSYTFTTQSIGLGAGSSAAIALGAEAAIVGQLQAAADAGLSPVNPAAQGWVGPEVDLASWTLADNGPFFDTGEDTTFGLASVFVGSMDVPYYSDPLGPLNPTGEQPWAARFGWPNLDAQGAFAGFTFNLTQFNPLPQVRSTERIPVLVTIPNDGQGGAPIAVESQAVTYFQHGIGGNRASLLGIADALASAGRIGIAIDLPMHGIEASDPTFGALSTGNAPGTPSGTLKERLLGVPADQSTLAFINLTSLTVALSNTQQAVADLTALRLTAPAFDFDGDGDADVNPADTSFIGLSLGGIVGTTALAIHAQAGVPAIPATLAAPGGGIAYLLQGSASFGPFVDGLLAQQGVVPGTASYDSFYFAAQTVVDGVDPINFSALLGASDYPVHLIEVVGNGVDNPSDTVVPNSAAGSPLAGTDPMIAAMGLEQHSFGTLTTDPPGGPVQAYVAFTEGGHSSLVFPGSDPTAADLAAFTEMQTQTVGFAASGGTALVITDDTVVQQ